MPKLITIQDVNDFVEAHTKCTLISTEYNGIKEKLIFKCHCGEFFNKSFMEFKGSKHQCNECSGLGRLTIEKIIEYTETHSNCKCLSTEYINNSTNLIFTCETIECNNIFETTWAKFKGRKKYKCNKCSVGEKNTAQTYSYKYVKETICNMGCKLISLEYTGIKKFLDIECKCKRIFSASFSRFKAGQTRCKVCSSKESKGEYTVRIWLEENNINFVREKVFDGCRNVESKRSLLFDFYLSKYNIIIEYDGQQHFYPVQFNNISEGKAENNFKQTQINDKTKNEYCKNNNIKLIRIPYIEFDNIEGILEEKLNAIKNPGISSK